MKPPSQDRNAIKDHLDEATEYVVITNVKAGSEEEAPQSHMYINGRADRLVDLIAMIFDRHPNLFGLMMERHQPEFLQELDFIRATIEAEGESTSDETPETDETDKTDDEVANATTLEEMRSLWTDIGLQIKEGGKQ